MQAKERPIIEMDELWSFVFAKIMVIWMWIAIDWQTRKIVGVAVGDRSAETCRALWQSLPPDYRKRAVMYTDEWGSYKKVLPSKQHRPVPKGSGETNHIERFNNTLRQRCANLVRKTLSFSKDLELHKNRILLFIAHYNMSVSV